MNLLSTLPYRETTDFGIRITQIKSGWMRFHLNANEDHLTYSASYLCDPLNDLLYATVLALDGSKPKSYVFHDLEGHNITWLINLSGDESTLTVWDGNVSDNDTLLTLARNNFDCDAFEVYTLDKLPDFAQDLKFALKCKTEIFIRALIDAANGLRHLIKYDESNWGFDFSQKDYDKLNKWLATREKLNDNFR